MWHSFPHPAPKFVCVTFHNNHFPFLLVEDANGDIIRCRWAESLQGECGGTCSAFPGATLSDVCERYLDLKHTMFTTDIVYNHFMFSLTYLGKDWEF